MKEKCLEQLSKLIDLKSILTFLMTLAMLIILVFSIEVNQAVFALFSTAYGSMITYFFTKKPNKESDNNAENKSTDL